MDKINVTAVCNRTIEAQKPEMKDWGFSFMAPVELEALRIAYVYRNNPHGIKVEHCPNVGQYMVTVFNELAAGMGIDGARKAPGTQGVTDEPVGEANEKDYSVLLLYPDSLSQNYGEETYYAHVKAASPAEAVKAAQKEAAEANAEDAEDEEEYAESFLPLLCIEGHHESFSHEDMTKSADTAPRP